MFFLMPKAFLYPIKEPFASINRLKYDPMVLLRMIVSGVPEGDDKYCIPTRITEVSRYLGVKIIEQEKDKLVFLMSRTLMGDVLYLNQKKLDKIRQDLANVTLFKEENKIKIEVNVKNIIQKLKNKDSVIDKRVMKRQVPSIIYNKINCDLKVLTRVTGGEFKVHADREFLSDIADRLYSRCDGKGEESKGVLRSTYKEESSKRVLTSWQELSNNLSKVSRTLRVWKK